MSKVMLSLPNNLLMRLKNLVPPGERSQVMVKLLKKEIEEREAELLYQSAIELEDNLALKAEMKEWDKAFSNDGLDYV